MTVTRCPCGSEKAERTKGNFKNEFNNCWTFQQIKGIKGGQRRPALRVWPLENPSKADGIGAIRMLCDFNKPSFPLCPKRARWERTGKEAMGGVKQEQEIQCAEVGWGRQAGAERGQRPGTTALLGCLSGEGFTPRKKNPEKCTGHWSFSLAQSWSVLAPSIGPTTAP